MTKKMKQYTNHNLLRLIYAKLHIPKTDAEAECRKLVGVLLRRIKP